MSSPLASGTLGTIDHVEPRAGDRAQRWLIWGAWFLTIVMFSGIATTLRGTSAAPLFAGLGWIVGLLATATLGALVVWKRRSLVQGWLLTGFAFFWTLGLFAYHFFGFPFIGLGSDSSLELGLIRTLVAIGDSAFVLAVVSFIILLLVGPDGSLPSPKWRWIAWFLVGFTPVMIWGQILNAGRVVDSDAWLSRSTWWSFEGVADRGATDQILDLAAIAVAVIFFSLMAWVLWHRIRNAGGERRQQLKWIAFACSAVLLWQVLWFPVPEAPWLMTLQTLLPGPALVLFSLGFGMALFKYRLWEIDVVVRRSLVYGVLWLAIAGVYVGVAAGFGMLAGAQFPIGIAIVLTAVATLVFQPARRWLEGVADRWVFGERDSPVEAIQSLGEGVAVSDRPQDIAMELAGTAMAALGLAWVAVEIEGSADAEVGTSNSEPETVLPVVWREEHYGSLRCRPHRSGTISPEDRVLLEALVGQAALAISHARLASRIVHAQERERRRIERNIHDGAQQDLATLVAHIGIARTTAGGDPTVLETLDRIQADASRILTEIRELAQGIHPSVLRDGGLVAAIEDRCSRLPIDVDVRVGEGLADVRLPAEIEAAAYFFTAEALSNALKHSDASLVEVALDLDGALVRLEVSDNGVGFDPETAAIGSGIVGLTDRIRALGGELTVSGNPSRGTVVAAQLPTPAMPSRTP